MSIAAATVAADLAGLQRLPGGGDVRQALPALAYLVLLGAVVAVTTWNLAVSRLGTQDASLFLNLLPITTFAIEMLRGYHASVAELGGAALTVAALIGGNLASRR